MSTANPPPPPMFSPGQPVPPPIKKQRASGTPGNDNVLNETEDAISRRRAELGRLQQMQKQSVPTINMARDQLLRPPSLPGTTTLSPNRGPPSSPMPPAAISMESTKHPPNEARPGSVSRRLDESFIPSNQQGNSQSTAFASGQSNGASLLSSNVPANQRTPQTQNRSTISGFPSPGKGLQLPGPPVISVKKPAAPGVVLQSASVPSGDPPHGSVLSAGPPTGPPPAAGPPSSFSSGSASQPTANPFRVDHSGGLAESQRKSHVSFQNTVTNIPRVGDGFTAATPSDPTPQVDLFPTPSGKDESSEGRSFAGHTPFPIRGNSASVETPEATNTWSDQHPPSSSRREVLNTMRSYADTPPGKVRNPNHSEVIVGNKEKKQVGFLSPMANVSTPAMRSLMSTPQSLSKRAPTPHPKISQTIGIDQQHLIEAAEVVTFEYESDAAVFTVRRPFGLATENELWFLAGVANAKTYAQSADVTKSTSFEIVATIHYDGSILALNGDVEVRHKLIDDVKWREFGNIKENDMLLGNVTYIDSDASEKQYALDAICEGALSVREHYCSSILSTGEAFRLRRDTLPRVVPLLMDTGIDDTAPLPKSPSVDANVGTEDMGTQIDKKSPPPVDDTDPDGGSDVLSTAVNLFFSTIFGTIWFFIVRIPFLILTHMFVMVVAAVLLSVLRLYAADDNGAAAMGASMSTFNRPGIL